MFDERIYFVGDGVFVICKINKGEKYIIFYLYSFICAEEVCMQMQSTTKNTSLINNNMKNFVR